MKKKLLKIIYCKALCITTLILCSHNQNKQEYVRFGYFANITHAQALVGMARGDFQKNLKDVSVKPFVFNAGPSVVEAFLAGQLDCAFIGPTPATNLFVKSRGAIKIVCGTALNGVLIVARAQSDIECMDDLTGKKIATPQYGNTQDISARVFVTEVLKDEIGERNGQTNIIPIANSEQIGALKRGDVDVCWTPEPWGTRMVNEAGGVIIAEEKDLWPSNKFSSTVFIMSTDFMKKHPHEGKTLVRTIVKLTSWINDHPDSAAKFINAQLKTITGKELEQPILKEALRRVFFSTDPFFETITEFARRSHKCGILEKKVSIDTLLDTAFLAHVKGEVNER